MSKKISFSMSGVGDEGYHDGQMICDYIYASSADGENAQAATSYEEITSLGVRDAGPMLISFSPDTTLDVSSEEGVVALTSGSSAAGNFSIFRREYQVFERPGIREGDTIQMDTFTYRGNWEPVIINTASSRVRDFNVESGRSYQYIIYPESATTKQAFANFQEDGVYEGTGKPVDVKWNTWSLIELIPIENAVDAPIVKQSYQVDLNNIWFFKYALDTGAQTQNIAKQEISNLGIYPKIGYGKQNYISGDVSCYLGSEIIPYTPEGYIERTRASITKPTSTNEKVQMLRQWRKLASSPNPKLLRDIKGQSWIVQVMSNSNTPHNFYRNQPDIISFSWKQIGDTSQVVIYGSGDVVDAQGKCDSIWKKVE